MDISDHDLRLIVRESIARHLAAGGPSRGPDAAPDHRHAAFARLPLSRGGDAGGACLIEPSVRCTHCGYCQSYGH